MAELGAGGGSSYPGAIDVDAVVEQDDVTNARADVPNDLADAIIKIQTELGTDPAGTAATVKARLDALATYIKVGVINSPGAGGNQVISGIGFQPGCVEFMACINDSVTQVRGGRGWMDYNGNQAAISETATGAVGRTESLTTHCILINDDGGADKVRAEFISMDADGFTINFDVANTGYKIYWKATR